MGVLLLFFLGSLLLTGLTLLALGLYGERITPLDRCAACRFELTGLASATCPECGVDLNQPGAKRTVRRRKRPGRIWSGLGLTLLALLGPALVLVDSLASGRLTSSMPSWLLVTELRMLGVQTPERVSDELLARSRRGDLSPPLWSWAARVGMSTRSGERALPASLNQLIFDAAAAGHVTKAEAARHSIVPFLCDVRGPERVRVGEQLISSLSNTGGTARVPVDMTWIWCRRIAGVEIDGVAQPMTQPKDEEACRQWLHALKFSPNTIYGTSPPQSISGVACVPATSVNAPGVHRIRVTFEVSVYNGPLDTAPGVAQFSREYTVEAFAPDAPLVQRSDSAELLAALRERLQPYVTHPRPGTPSWTMGIHDDNGYKQPRFAAGLRAGGAWDVFVESEGERHRVGTYKTLLLEDRPWNSMAWRGDVRIPAEIKRCKVVFVPNEQLAVERPAVHLMPASELVFDDVPVH